MTLGQLIDVLERCPQNEAVMFDFAGLVPDGFWSYRGFYEDLALGFRASDPVMLSDFLPKLRAVVGRTFTGYKGGDFTMTRDTRMWVAGEHRDASGTAIIGVRPLPWGTMILTHHWTDR